VAPRRWRGPEKIYDEHVKAKKAKLEKMKKKGELE
jgi:hypothetical protein